MSPMQGKSLVLFGGEASGQENFQEFSEVHLFNIETATWKEVPAKGLHPMPRTKHGAVVFNNKLIVLGGEHDFSVPQFDVAVFNLGNRKKDFLFSKLNPKE